MKNNTQLSELTDLQVVTNGEEVKGGTLFLIKHLLFGGFKGGYYGGHYGGHYGGGKKGY
jgi:hypothetical protein